MSRAASTEAIERKALIVGGGIAGPVLAMFPRRAGITPVVYEGRPGPDDEAGYFLNLAPNGVAVLDSLGIRDEVLGRDTPTTSIVFQNHRCKPLGCSPRRPSCSSGGCSTKRSARRRSGAASSSSSASASRASRSPPTAP